MPIYDFRCRACDHRFEEWVRKEGMGANRPACGSQNFEREMSPPAVHSEGVEQKGLRSAKREENKLGKELAWTQKQYELHHND